MNTTCNDFRRRLEALLTQPDTAAELTVLGWHEHLHGCGDCRALLEAEEALEVLLAGLPEPVIPRELAARLLRRLAAERAPASAAHDLDTLLALDRTEVPGDLAQRVLAGLAAARSSQVGEASAQRAPRRPRVLSGTGSGDPLDTLLERVPAPPPPADLAQRVLAELAPHRRMAHRLRLVRAGAPAVLAAAAVLLAAVGAYVWWPAGPAQRLGVDLVGDLARVETGATPAAEPNGWIEPAPDLEPAGLEPVGQEPSAPLQPAATGGADWAPADEALLADLDLLEDWELLLGDDMDLLLGTLDAPDELLLRSESEASAPLTPGSSGGAGEFLDTSDPERG